MDKKHLLYGKDLEENIVAIETIKNQAFVEIFKRDNGVLTSRIEPFEYLIYSRDTDPVFAQLDTIKCLGTNFYNAYYKTDNTSLLYEIRKKSEDCFLPLTDSQYQLQTGKTLFKGMGFDDPLILYFDLEVLTKEGFHFPNSHRSEDIIFMVAVRTNKGDEWVYYIDDEIKNTVEDGVNMISVPNEKTLIQEFIELFRTVDPDIVVNHNIFNFDLNYLRDRCMLNGVKMSLGRNGSEPSYFETKIKFADRDKDYTNYDIYGRHVIDTQFLAESADVVLRNMPSYKLKDLVKYLGKASDDRVYIEGGDISRTWREDKQKLIKYAIEDVREAEILYKQFGEASFLCSQFVPMSYQKVFRYGTGTQIDNIFFREYIDKQWSIPKPSKKVEYPGGYADVFAYGLFKEPLIYADVESLYPSLGRLLQIQPKKDELFLYQDILNLLIDTRFTIKKKIREFKNQGRDDLAKKQKAFDGAIKIYLNTMSYGWLGWEWGHFNDYGEAERITREGQHILKLMIKCVADDGGRTIKCDTDGILCTVPPEYRGSEEKENEYLETLTKRMPKGIKIGHDGRYQGVLSVDKKSYALYEYDGKITIKGNSLRGRGVEGMTTTFITKTIDLLFNDNKHKIKTYYQNYQDKIKLKGLTKEEVGVRKNLKMTLEEYKNRRESGDTQTIAQYEVALKSDKPLTKGDVIVTYVSEFPTKLMLVRNKPVIRKEKLAVHEASKIIDDFDYDIEPSYYLERLEKAAKKLMILGPERFNNIFDGLIKVKAADIKRYENLTNLLWK